MTYLRGRVESNAAGAAGSVSCDGAPSGGLSAAPASRSRRSPGSLSALLLAALFFTTIPAGLCRAEGESLPPAAKKANTAQRLDVASLMQKGGLTYNDCVRIALFQSPHFIKSSLEIEVKRLDESDSKYRMLPSVYISTQYRLNNPDDRSGDPFTMSFNVGSYDPLKAFFTLRVNKILTKVAVQKHLKDISEGLHTLGLAFLDLGYHDQVAGLQDELTETARRGKAFVESRFASGMLSSLDVMIADQKVQEALLQKDVDLAERARAFESLKRFLGLGLENNLALDLNAVAGQVIASFTPTKVSLDQARSNSIELKARMLQKEAQHATYVGAFGEYVPKFNFSVGREYSAKNNENINLFYVGFTTPLWEWGERYRNVLRQDLKTQQEAAGVKLGESEIDQMYLAASSKCRVSAAAAKLAWAKEELASRQKQQAEVAYKSGTLLFQKYQEKIYEYYAARKEAFLKEHDYDKNLFDLRFISGDLYRSYVDASNY